MASADTCSKCGQELRGDSNYCGVCGTRIRRSEPIGFGSKDDPWGDRQTEAEWIAQHAHSRENDRLAGMSTRTGSYLINALLPSFLGFIPVLGIVIYAAWYPVTLYKWRRGQDIGASLMKIRVVRDNGDVAGFYHMWTRNLAAIISLIALGAGYWTAYFDENNRTWHDKWMGTYVIWDNPDAALRPGTSSSVAVKWFWASVLIVISLIVFAGFAATRFVLNFSG